MKILYHHRIKSRDGQYIHIRSLVDALRRRGNTVEEIGLTAGETFSLGEESPFWKGLVDRVPSPIMELLGYVYSLPAAFWIWSRLLRDPPDLLYERYALGNFAGVLAARWAGVPIFLEVNSPLAQEKKETGHLSFSSLARLSERSILRAADRVLVVSRALKDIFVDRGVDPRRIAVIPNGIDPEPFLRGDREGFRRRFGLGEAVVLGFVGFFREWHRLDLLLDLLETAPPEPSLKLMLVGDGPARPGLEERIREKGIAEKVVWTGILDRHEIPSALAAMDIAVQPDVTAYASPLKLFEYMAAGKAVVAPRRRNIREIIEEGRSGLLFEPENLETLVGAVRRLVKDPELRRRMGDAARETLLERGYTWEANADRVLRLLDEIRS